LSYNDPMRTLVCVHVQPLTVVAADAFSCDYFRSLNRAPLARLFADSAGVALRPALDSKHRQIRQQPQECPDWAQEAAIKVSDEDRRQKKSSERDPHTDRSLAGKHPE